MGVATLRHLQEKGLSTIGVSRHSALIAADIMTDEGLSKLTKEVNNHGGLQGVVQFIGGQNGEGKVSEVSDKDWMATFQTNVLSTVRLSRALGPFMKPGSCWLNISSSMARSPSQFNAHYSASKAALESLSRSMAIDWSDRGVRVLSLRLGAVDAPKTRAKENFNLDRTLSRIALGRMGTTEDVAGMVGLLLSKEAAWTTGHVIDLDGGTGLR